MSFWISFWFLDFNRLFSAWVGFHSRNNNAVGFGQVKLVLKMSWLSHKAPANNDLLICIAVQFHSIWDLNWSSNNIELELVISIGQNNYFMELNLSLPIELHWMVSINQFTLILLTKTQIIFDSFPAYQL